jgi:hypothetical protein
MKKVIFLIFIVMMSGLWAVPVFAGPNDPPSADSGDRDDRDEDEGEDWFEQDPNGVPEDALGPREIADVGRGHLEEGSASEGTLSVPDHTSAAAPVRRKNLERPLPPLEHQEETTASPHDRVKPLRAALDRERKQDQLVAVASEGRVLTVDQDSSSESSSEESSERESEEERRRREEE